MSDHLRRIVGQLDRLEVPDLTQEIELRIAVGPSAEPRAPGPRTTFGRAALTIGVVVSVIAGWVVLTRVLPDMEAPSPAGPSFAGSLVLGVGEEGGTRLYVIQPDGTGYRDGGQDGTALRIAGGDVAISPDGTRLAFVRGEDGESGLWVSNVDGSDAVLLTQGPTPTWDSDPAWSPDGTRIVFSRNRAGQNELFVIDADGSDLRQITTNGVGQDLLPAWSPVGSAIVFTRNSGGPIDLWLVDPDGTNVRQLTHFERGDGGPGFAAWSPDGTKIAFSAPAPRGEGDDRHAHDLYVVDVAGASEPVRLTDGPRDEISQTWSPDSTLIAYLAGPEAPDEFGNPVIGGPYRPLLLDVSSGEVRELSGPDGLAFWRPWLAWPTAGTRMSPPPEQSQVKESAGVAQVTCAEDGIEVLTPVVRVQPDGVHVRVENTARAEALEIFLELWDDGAMSVGLGGADADLVLEVPPGKALVACVPAEGGPMPDSLDERRTAVPIQIADPDALWSSDSLSCGYQDRNYPDRPELSAYASVNPVHTDLEAVLRRAVPGILPSDQVGPAGYREGDPRLRQWRVVRDGKVAALIKYPSRTGGSSDLLSVAYLSPIAACEGSGIGQAGGETAGLLATPFEVPGYPRCDPYSEECSLVYVSAERYRQLGGGPEPRIIVADGSTQCFQDGMPTPCADRPPGSFWYALRMTPAVASTFEQTYGCGATLHEICT